MLIEAGKEVLEGVSTAGDMLPRAAEEVLNGVNDSVEILKDVPGAVNTAIETFKTSLQIEPGNIDLNSRPVVKNKDGSISTERSIIIEEDGECILIPTVVDGEIVSDEEAIEHYHRTNQHHGKYDNLKDAEKDARRLSDIQRKRYLKV